MDQHVAMRGVKQRQITDRRGYNNEATYRSNKCTAVEQKLTAPPSQPVLWPSSKYIHSTPDMTMVTRTTIATIQLSISPSIHHNTRSGSSPRPGLPRYIYAWPLRRPQHGSKRPSVPRGQFWMITTPWLNPKAS